MAQPARPLGTVERDAVLSTKLRVPRIRADRLDRRRLIQRLEEASDRELILISAPPGFGKSTLLAAWARSTQRPVAWVSLDSDDNDPSRFWRCVVASVDRAHRGLQEHLLPLLDAGQPLAAEAVAAALVNELAARQAHPLSLVLDDYHALESPSIHEGLAFLLDHMPNDLQLILAGRGNPPLPLALMRSRGQLMELRADDLRFTREEAASLLLDAWGLDLAQASVEALAEKTEGWATGLQLAAVSIRGSADPLEFVAGFTGSHRHVLDYLTEEVLERQPDQIRAFLLETSILERLSGALCDAVTGRSDGRQLLEQIERANLFLVALDDERRWYRYHRLFGELLRARLDESNPGRARELHRRAAAWCDEHGLIDDAVRHALAGGDSRMAAAIVEQHVDEVLGRGEGATLRRWLSALPPALVRSRPGISLVQAIAAFNAGQLGSAESLLDGAEHALASAGSEPEPAAGAPESPLANVRATIESVRASLATARGRPEMASAHLERALSVLAESGRGPSLSVRWNRAMVDWMEGRPPDAERELATLVAEGRASGMPHLAISAGAILGKVQRAQGKLGAALRTYREGLDLGVVAGRATVPTVGEAHIGIAEILYEQDQLDEATRHVTQGIELCRQLISTQSLATGLARRAWIQQARGDPRRALESMKEASRVLTSHDVVSLFNPVPAARARLLLAQGRLPEVAAWVEERGCGEDHQPAYAREAEYLVLVRLLLAKAMPDRALGLLGRLRALAEDQGRTGSVIEAGALEALAIGAVGDRSRALERLAGALALGRPEGYVRVFADEGRPMAALLGGLVGGGRRQAASGTAAVSTDYLGRLLRAVRMSATQAGARAGMVEALTARELEVLAMLAAGRSNREISERLVVTLDTVKKHVTHILDKLGAANRTQAVAMGRELGLIN